MFGVQAVSLSVCLSLSLSLYILNLRFFHSISSSIAPSPLFHLHRLLAEKKRKEKLSRIVSICEYSISIFPFFSIVSALFFFFFSGLTLSRTLRFFSGMFFSSLTFFFGEGLFIYLFIIIIKKKMRSMCMIKCRLEVLIFIFLY